MFDSIDEKNRRRSLMVAAGLTQAEVARKLGVKPGPDFSRILRKTLYAKIDGLLKTKTDELLYAERLAKKI